jgi:ATP synthase protein I
MASTDPKGTGRFEAMRTFGQIGTLGLSFVFAIAIGAIFGHWLDGLTGWAPWCFITFFILGFAAGVLNVYRTLSRLK